MAVEIERIVEEDLNLGTGLVDVTMPGGGTAVGHQIGTHTFVAEAFIASMDGGQAVIGGAAPVVVALDTEELDVVGWFEPVTAVFAPTVSGRYQIDAYLQMAALTGTVTIAIYKNTTEVVAVEVVRSAASGRATLSAMVSLNGGSDEVTLRVSHSDGANSININAARMSGFLVGKAAQ